MRSDRPTIFPADWVTLTRALLIAGVTGLVADSFGRPVSITALVTRVPPWHWALDAVDGQGGAPDRNRHPAGRSLRW